MNNTEFRNLLQNDGEKSQATARHGSAGGALGSRSRGSIPMTPRSVAGRSGYKFSRQDEGDARGNDGEPPAKRFKTVAVPRGMKLAQGYSDRSTFRRDEDDKGEKDAKIKKLKELEQMVKEEKIDHATFERLREQMGIGGDLSTTHLVKGLDFKLLERARQGEDLNKTEAAAPDEEEIAKVDDELDDVLQKEVVARKRDVDENSVDHADSADPEQPLSRDEILRRLKQSRNAPSKVAPEPALGNRFKKVETTNKPGKKKFIETVDGRRREVLLIKQADGSTKRKSRWLDPQPIAVKESISKKDPIARKEPQPQPLGMEVPAELLAKQKAREAAEEAEDDDDIFQGVGADYDPLAGIDSDADDDTTAVNKDANVSDQPRPARKYFEDGDANLNDKEKSSKRDATLMAAFKKAATIRNEESKNPIVPTDQGSSDKSKQFLEKLKEDERQDRADMDLGFGESRFGDDDDDEDGPIYDEGDDEGKSKRKRGGKKRKGDKDNVADVMSVLEGRKK